MDKTKLEWNNLKNVCCPKCEARLIEGMTGYKCSRESDFHSCDFRISHDRFVSVVKSMYEPTDWERRQSRIVTEEENLRELNNL